SPVGSGPDRLPTLTTPHDGPQGADPLRRATTGIHRASHQGAARAKPSSHRDEHVAPGNLVHVAVKKLGRIPRRRREQRPWPRPRHGHPGQPPAGHRVPAPRHGRPLTTGPLRDARGRTQGNGRRFLDTSHHLVRSLRYRAHPPCPHRQRLLLPLPSLPRRVAATGTRHKRTQPYRAQTNNRMEPFNRTLTEGYAYARVYNNETRHRLPRLPPQLPSPLRSHHTTAQLPAMFLVGLTGFEPATPSPPVRCATKLRHSPKSPCRRRHREAYLV